MASELLGRCRDDRQLQQARAFAEWILERQMRDKKRLMQALALDNESRRRFFRLFDGIEHLPSREYALAGAREMLAPNREAAHKQRLSALLTTKRSISDLTAEERQELQQLSRQNQD
jgi:DNA primase